MLRRFHRMIAAALDETIASHGTSISHGTVRGAKEVTTVLDCRIMSKL